jgi:hypothetical protein
VLYFVEHWLLAAFRLTSRDHHGLNVNVVDAFGHETKISAPVLRDVLHVLDVAAGSSPTTFRLPSKRRTAEWIYVLGDLLPGVAAEVLGVTLDLIVKGKQRIGVWRKCPTGNLETAHRYNTLHAMMSLEDRKTLTKAEWQILRALPVKPCFQRSLDTRVTPFGVVQENRDPVAALEAMKELIARCAKDYREGIGQ